MDFEINQEAQNALNRLAALPGMQQVQQQVEQMIQFARVAKLRAKHRLKSQAQSHHMLFTGNPGTGKTTAARLIGEAFAAIGLLKRTGGDVPFVEVHHSKIAGGVVGESEKNMTAAFKKARGGVLFIDEAYSFVGKADHKVDEKVVATIVQCIEDMRDEVVVIAAGYSNKMKEFMAFNPGLPSRFPTTIHFADYSVPDLIRITKQMIGDQDFQATPDYYDALTSVLWIEKAKPNFGNARTVRNHVERSIRQQAVRVSQLPNPARLDLTMLLARDLVYSVRDVRAAEKEALTKIVRDAQTRLMVLDFMEISQRSRE